MASQGPLYAGTGASDAAFGTYAWSNPGNITADDGTRASATFAATGQSEYLKATNFGFTIPTGATVDGIVVEVKEYNPSVGSVSTARARIVKGGAISATNKTATDWPAVEAYSTFGSSSDKWGETWTAADINASNFGFVISADSNTSAITISCDAIRITVHYTAPPAGLLLTGAGS